MEFSGVTNHRLSCMIAGNTGLNLGSNDCKPSHAYVPRSTYRIRKSIARLGNFGYIDKSHEEFYRSGRNACLCSKDSGLFTIHNEQKKQKESKKKLKLLKRLCDDLRTLSQGSLVTDLDVASSEAAEVLMKRLEQLRAEEQECKQETKNKAKRYVEDQQMMAGCDSSSSSSESSDSDNECCEQIIDATSTKQYDQGTESSIRKDYQITPIESPCTQKEVPEAIEMINKPFPEATNTKKIEVCMGSKCRKSGGVALLEELDKAMGTTGAVIGSKCMKNCKNGPNVRILEGTDNPNSLLCIGVNMNDVGTIATNCLNVK